PSRPLVVGISAIQGGGKTTLTRNLISHFQSLSLRVIALSIDDFYLPSAQQQSLKSQNPQNKLLELRGNPGTHDTALCRTVLEELITQHTRWCQNSQQSLPTVVQIPQYDKSLNNGLGDRLKDSLSVAPPFDIILLEGWMLGFKPVPLDQLSSLYSNSGMTSNVFRRHSIADLQCIMRNLESFVTDIYPLLDSFIHMSVQDLNVVYQWRLEQEQQLIAEKGVGMNDEQTQHFVDRFMPLYELCLPRLTSENVFCDVDCWWNQVHDKIDPSEVDTFSRHWQITLDRNR
ncbi:P-loop containing nucleoside triphosphate hydrolase protein, partial [Paraphysoderma sedebokerense]